MVTVCDSLRTDPVPVCSVCIANFNGTAVIAACLDSVFSQDLDLPIEIIVHDDASTDGSAEFIRRAYPTARLLVSETNVGFCVSNNRMVALARGRYILLLNNDATLQQDALRTLYTRATTTPELEILGLPQYDMESGTLIDRGCLLDPFLNPVPILDYGRQTAAMQIGACLWIPRALWEKLAGFPEWFGSLAEDMYLCLAAWNAGYAVRIETGSGYHHWVGASLGGGKVIKNRLATTYRRRALSERNKTYIMILFFPTALLLAILPVHLTLLAVEGIVLSLAQRQWKPFRLIYWPVLRAIWSNRHALRRARDRIQAQRKIPRTRLLSLFTFRPYKLAMLRRHGIPHLR